MTSSLQSLEAADSLPAVSQTRRLRVPDSARKLLHTRLFLPLLLIVTSFVHAYRMLGYPLYLGDEGIYMEQAWAVLKGKGLAPYTYFYDHAPAGWILIAAWLRLLPQGIYQWGMAINSGRVLMLLLAAASTALVYRLAWRSTGSHATGVLAGLIFALSPLSMYYGRLVLLDNIMVFWLLLSLDLVTEGRGLFAVLASGAAFGLAVLTKENAIFFAPVVGVALYKFSQERHFFRFGVSGWLYASLSVISIYPLYALLKGELFGDDTFLVSARGGHVNLLGAIEWQLSRSAAHGSVLDYPHGEFWSYYFTTWAPKDHVILIGGAAAVALNIVLAVLRPDMRRAYLMAAALAVSFALYLARGAVLLEFYVVPLLPFLALNIALAVHALVRPLPRRWTEGLLLGMAVAAGLFFTRLEPGAQDFYSLQQTQLQAAQLAFIRTHIPHHARIMIDDDLWVDLHDSNNGAFPVYPHADSHWKIAGDPAVRDNPKGIQRNWRRVDYVVASNRMLTALKRDTTDYYHVALNAYKHSYTIWRFPLGGTTVEVRKVEPSHALFVRWAARHGLLKPFPLPARSSSSNPVCSDRTCGTGLDY